MAKASELRKQMNRNGVVLSQDYINDYVNDVNKFYKTSQGNYDTIGYSNSKQLYDSTNAEYERLKRQGEEIRKNIAVLNKGYGYENFRNIMSTIGSFEKDAKPIVDAYKGNNDFYSQFETQQSYDDFGYYQNLKDRSFVELMDIAKNSTDVKEVDFINRYTKNNLGLVSKMSEEDIRKHITGVDTLDVNSLNNEEALKLNFITQRNGGMKKPGKNFYFVPTGGMDADGMANMEKLDITEENDERIQRLYDEYINYFKTNYNIDLTQYDQDYRTNDYVVKLDRSQQVAYYDKNGLPVTWAQQLAYTSAQEDIAGLLDDENAYNKLYTELASYGEDGKRALDVLIEEKLRNDYAKSGEQLDENLMAVLIDKERARYEEEAVSKGLATPEDAIREKQTGYTADEYYNGMVVPESSAHDMSKIKSYLNYKAEVNSYAEQMKKDSEWAYEHPLGASLANLAIAPMQVVDMFGSAAEAGASKNFDDNEIGSLANPYNDSFVNRVNAYNQGVSDRVYDDVYNLTGKKGLAEFTKSAYSGVSSAAQSAVLGTVSTAILGPQAGPAVAAGIMGTQAAASAYNNAALNGSTPEQAFWSGVAAGVAETVFEKVSIDKFIELKGGIDISSTKAFLKSVLKNSGNSLVQGFVEGSEELATELTNNVTDKLINGNYGAYAREVEKYVTLGGYSIEDAQRLATKDQVTQAFESALGGFVGGSVGGGIKTGYQATVGGYALANKNKLAGTSITGNESTNQLLDIAMSLPDTQENAAIKELAKSIQGVDVSSMSKKSSRTYTKDVGRLYNMLVQSEISQLNNSDSTVIKEQIRQKFTEIGVSDVSDRTVDALYKAYTNQKLSTKENVAVSSEQNQQVLDYLNKNSERIYDEIDNAKSENILRFYELQKLSNDIEASFDFSVDEFSTSDDGKTYIAGTSQAVEIKGIKSVSDNDITVELSDGSTQNLRNIDLGDTNDAIIYQGVIDIQNELGANLGSKTANSLMLAYRKTGGNALTFINNAKIALMRGYSNVGLSKSVVSSLTADVAEAIYDLGRVLRKSEAARRTEIAQKKTKSSENTTVTLENIDESELTPIQKTSLKAATHTLKKLGTNVVFYRSKRVNGKWTSKYDTKNGSPNGFYDADTNTVYLDIRAGLTGKGIMLFTAAHEITHTIREWSPESFDTFADFLMEKYGDKNIDVDELIREKMRKLKLSYDAAFEEVVADSCESFLVDSNMIENIQELNEKDKGLVNHIISFFKNLLQKVREVYAKLNPDSQEGRYVRNMKDALSELHSKWIEAVKTTSQNISAAQIDTTKNTAKNDGVKKSDRIKINMLDKERYEILKNRKIEVVNIKQSNFTKVIQENPELLDKKLKISEATKILRKIAEEFDVYKKYSNSDIEVEFEFGKNNLNESVSKQKYNYDLFAQMLSCFSDIVSNAVGVEVHNRNSEGYKPDITLKNVYVLFGAFKNATDVVPVKLEIKEFFDKPNRLYVAVALNGIKNDRVVSMGVPNNRSHVRTSPVTYSIYDLFKKINTKDVDFIKYLPDEFLTEEQLQSKKEYFNKHNSGIKKSERITTDAVNYFGTTYSWAETGYLLTDGRRLDFSGKKHGARPGGRSQDHREILDAYSEEEQNNMSGSEAMVDFMSKGNIRIQPEMYGINLSVQPTKAQETKLAEFIKRADGEVILDIDDAKGNTVVSVEYPYGTRASKILNDIKQYFIDGTEPYVSDTQRFLYQARPDISDMLFDDADEFSEIDAYMVGEYLRNNKDSNVAYHLINNTRNIPIGDGKLRTIISRLVRSYGLTNVENKDLTVALMSLLESQNKAEVDENTELLRAVFEKVVKESEFISEDSRHLRDELNEYLKDYRKEHSVYMNDEQLSSLEFQGRSVKWLRNKLAGIVNIVKEDSDIKTKKTSFGYFMHDLAQAFPEVFSMDLVDQIDNWEIFIEKMEKINNPEDIGVENAYGMDVTQFSSELASRLLADVVENKYNSKQNAYVDTLVKKLRREHNERVREVRIREQKKIKDAQQKKYDKLVAEHKRQRENYREGRNKTEIKNKIRNAIKQLDGYLNHGNKKKNVKEGMRDFASKALELADIIFENDIKNEDIINRGVVGMSEREQKYYDKYKTALQQRAIKEERLNKVQEHGSWQTMQEIYREIQKIDDEIKYYNTQLKDLFAREKAKIYEMPVKDAVSALFDAYEEIKNSEYSYIANAYDENVADVLRSLKEKVGGTRVKDMSIEQLNKVYEGFAIVLGTIRNANKLFGLEKSVAEIGDITSKELESVKDAKDVESELRRLSRDYMYNSMKPVYFFRMLGSKTLEKLYWNLQNAELKWYANVLKVQQFRKQIADKYNYKSWNFKKEYKFKDVHNNEFGLKLEEIMSLYAYSRRPQALDHLLRDGFVHDKNIKVYDTNENGKKVKKVGLRSGKKSHSLDVDILAQITGTLTDEQRQFVKDMQKYLSTDMAELGNQISMKMYGIKRFNELNYFPIRVSRDFLPTDYSSKEAETLQKSKGFTKDTQKKAGQPIVISEFSQVWAKHCDSMSQYNAFVLPLEDIMKVLNYRTSAVSTGDAADAIKQKISSIWGDAAQNYITTFIKDVNGGVRADNITLADKSLTLMKKASVVASASVVIQQPFAVGRAMAYIKPKYFLKSVPKAFNLAQHNKDWAELKKYSPIAGIKEMGYFDTDIGQNTLDWILKDEYKGKEKLGAFFTDSNYRDDVLSVAPAMADELAWVQLWHAVKAEIKDTTDLEGEAYFDRCGERFNEVVQLTQVYDSVFSRSGYMRNRSTFAKMATAFMAEPTVTLNMNMDALMQWKRNGKAGAKAALGTLSAVLASQIVTGLAKALWTANRDDDEDKKWIEKYLGKAKSEVWSNWVPLEQMVFVKDIVSLFEGYSVDRLDMQVFAEAITKSKKLGEAIFDDEKEVTAEVVLDALGAYSSLVGVPLKNIIKDIRTGINLTESVFNVDIDKNKKSSAAMVRDTYNLYLSGKSSEVKENVDTMVQEKYNKYYSEGDTKADAKKNAVSSVRTSFTREYKEKYLDAFYSGDKTTYTEIRKMLYATGLYGSLTELDKTIAKWKKDYQEEQKKKKRAEKRAK